MALRLDADECVDGRIVAGLTRRGVDILTAGSLGLLGASDKEQLARATTAHHPLPISASAATEPRQNARRPGPRRDVRRGATLCP